MSALAQAWLCGAREAGQIQEGRQGNHELGEEFLAEPSGKIEELKNSWQSQAAKPSGKIEEFLAEPSGEAERKN
jgi:hypothetical protein